MTDPSPPVVIGWRECVGLPDLDVPALRAKIDTGARTCALHVDAQWRFVDGGAPWVGFRVTPGGGDGGGVELQAPVHDEREVVDSGGHRGVRVFLRTRLRLAGAERVVEVNLADRRGMRFPMLVGRSALAGFFAVDPSRSFIHGRAPRRPHVSVPTP
ncbi:MAG TPA: RimK/LysX family protein [Lysobacter sp.]|nr:RimK/LysX family protein [Lysobacter sp.]